jgi:hypothetical protein
MAIEPPDTKAHNWFVIQRAVSLLLTALPFSPPNTNASFTQTHICVHFWSCHVYLCAFLVFLRTFLRIFSPHPPLAAQISPLKTHFSREISPKKAKIHVNENL